MIEIPLLPDQKIYEYLTSQPHFKHDLFAVQKYCYGRIFNSRGNSKKMYHRTARQLRLVREQIEKDYNGEFVDELGEQGIKQYRFKKNKEVDLKFNDE